MVSAQYLRVYSLTSPWIANDITVGVTRTLVMMARSASSGGKSIKLFTDVSTSL